MQIVIDIPKTLYDRAKKPPILGVYEEIIAKGIPLSKGHGRIADMDEAIKCIKDAEGEDAIWAIGLIEWACNKRTIIEADKESEEV